MPDSSTELSHHATVRPRSSALASVIDVEARHAVTPAPSGFTLPFDPLRLIDAVYARWWVALIAGIVLAAALGFYATQRFNTHHRASAQLIKLASPNTLRQSEGGDPYQPHETSIPTMMAMMRSGAVMERAAARLEGKMSESLLRAGLIITPERNTDIIRVTVNSDHDSATALAGLEAYLAEVLDFSRKIQQRDAGEMGKILARQIEQSDQELIKLNEELLEYAKREKLVDPDKQTDALLGELASYSLKYEELRLQHETLDLRTASIENELSKVSPAAAKLDAARAELAQLKLRYTEAHPAVIDAIAFVQSLEAVAQDEAPRLNSPPKPGESAVAESLYLELVQLRGEKQVIGEQLGKLNAVRESLNARLEQLPRKSLELAAIKSRKAAVETSRTLLAARQREAALVEESAEGDYRLLSMDRLQDAVIETPSKKILMLTAGGFFIGAGGVVFLSVLFVLMDRRLRSSNDLRRALKVPVVGALFESSAADEKKARTWAFRTWTHLHPTLHPGENEGATVCGLLMNEPGTLPCLLGEAAARRGASVLVVTRETTESSVELESALEYPEEIITHLTARPERVLHLQMSDDWAWTGEQRRQWTAALALWSKTERLVILVELHDPRQAETLLVAEQLPNLLWIGSGAADGKRTREESALYHAAGCHLVGALYDRAPKFRLPLLNQFAAAACVLFASVHLHAQSPVFLGAGDIVNLTVAGQPELARNGVTIAPDGTITYLHAQAIPAAGLSLDQLRASLTTELRRYYHNAIVVVTPNLFQSNKVYVLGKIVKKGAVTLDRPMRVVDVVAEAGGLETGLFQQNTVELADLGRSFLMRGGAKVDVNLEALFLKGDMSQNAPVAAGDYLYLPSANSNEIYVLGNVKMQGTQGLLAHTSVHSAIAQAGGFTQKAYQKRVLVVRGSLDQPETFVVNMEDIMAARDIGFRLEPRDIVYIADRPWARAEELLVFAINAFTQGAVSSWAGANIGPMIGEAVLPSIR
jgi:protein involved in polysaccharide export with SLBB domain/capsular polysaccharide biosynthesis protein